MGAPFEKTMVFGCLLRTVPYTESEFFTFKKIQKKIFYAIVASALLSPVTVAADFAETHPKYAHALENVKIKEQENKVITQMKNRSERIVKTINEIQKHVKSMDDEGHEGHEAKQALRKLIHKTTQEESGSESV